MLRSIRNDDGYAINAVAVILTVLILIFTLLYFSIFKIRAKSEPIYQCRQEFYKTHLRTSKYYDRILALNPKSRKIRLDLELARKKVAIAIKSKIPAAIAAAEANLLSVKARQLSLHLQQKSLWRQSEFLLMKSTQNARSDWNSWQSKNRLKTVLLDQTSTWISDSQGKVPLVPEDSDMAPAYEFDSRLSRQNPLESKWQIRSTVKPIGFSSYQSQSEESCAVYLDREENKWVPKIIVGKF